MNSVQVATKVGPMSLPANDGGFTLPLIAAGGEWEPSEEEAIRRVLRPGDTFIDVGAHCGYFTRMMAQIVGPKGKGRAFEPHPDNFSLLLKNTRKYFPVVWAYESAVLDNSEDILLFPSTVNSGDNRIDTHVESGEAFEVHSVVLDDFLKCDVPRLIKIDTQGSDHRVIWGARKMISKCSPYIITEWWPEGLRNAGEDPSFVLLFLLNLGHVEPLIEEPPNNLMDVGYCSLLITPWGHEAS